MKRSLFFLLGIMLMGLGATAQPDYQKFGLAIGVTDTDFPFNSNTNNKVQMLYLKRGGQYFAGAPNGVITHVWFYCPPGGGNTNVSLVNLRIKLGQTTATTTSPTFSTSLTEVLFEPLYTIPVVPSNGWVGFELQTPFDYDVDLSLVVEVSHEGVTNGFSLRADQIAPAENKRTYGATGSSSGSVDNQLADFGFSIKYDCDSVRNFRIVPGSATDTSIQVTWDYWSQQDSLYEYIVTDSSHSPQTWGGNGPYVPGGNNFQPLTSSQGLQISGLEPESCKWIWISKVCKRTSISDTSRRWVGLEICTLPACETPEFEINNVGATTAIASWDPVPGVYQYEYAVSVSPTPPTQGTLTTYTNVLLQGLTNNWAYYFHLRALCNPIPLSRWGTKSFHTEAMSVEDFGDGTREMMAYPNPAYDQLTVRLANAPIGKASLQVMDLSGRVMMEHTVDGLENSLQLGALPSGMYMIHYQDDMSSKMMKFTKH